MHLTKKSDYAFRVMIYLQEVNELVKIRNLASALSVSKNHLSVVVNKLSELGYLESVQGPNGGIKINNQCLDWPILPLLEEFESFNLVECFDSKTNSCTLSKICGLKVILNKATKSFLAEFSKYRIRDLSNPRKSRI